MTDETSFRPVLPRLLLLTGGLGLFLLLSVIVGVSLGSSSRDMHEAFRVLLAGPRDPSAAATIVWKIRLPRVLLSGLVGAILALGGLVFQAILRNPLAEPYILGISGGSAIGAIIGILAGFSPFPGITLAAFGGSMAILFIILFLAGGSSGRKDSLLLGGVMMNAFSGAAIMFLIALSRSSEMRQIFYWLMGDLSMTSPEQLWIPALALPCFLLVFFLARPMNLLLLGAEAAESMGVNIKRVTTTLLVTTSFMVSLAVCQSGLVGFVGLLIPHVFRLLLGSDNRLLVPACVLGGSGYLILCDMLARTLPTEGEMPVGIITAMIGAPLFITLLWRSRR